MSYKKEFAQKVIVVTGASAGLGRALVREFAKYNTKIALLARGVDGLNAAQEEVEALGSQALVIPVDVSNAEQVEQAAQQIEDTLGPIDIWINNAMAAVLSPFKEMNAEDFKRVTEVTYLGQVYGTMAALKRMLPRDRGKIILIGSALAYRGIPLQTSYCGAKHGIHGFFESLRTELIHDKSKVHLGMVQLPAMNTTQFDLVKTHLPKKSRPMGTIYEPEVAARAITYAAAYPKREIFVGYPTWQTILGNKFSTQFSGLLFRQNRLPRTTKLINRQTLIVRIISGNPCPATTGPTVLFRPNLGILVRWYGELPIAGSPLQA